MAKPVEPAPPPQWGPHQRVIICMGGYRELARQLNVPASTAQKWFAGDRIPRPQQVMDLAARLGLPLRADDFFALPGADYAATMADLSRRFPAAAPHLAARYPYMTDEAKRIRGLI